jgi:cytochrome c peroxidase
MRDRERVTIVLLSFLAASLLLLAGCKSSREVGEPSKLVPAIAPTPYNLAYPVGLSADGAVIPKENPLTVEKIKLGRRLYFEKSLSIDGTVSCATCHAPEKGFSDDEPTSTGVGGKKGDRHSPTVVNRIFSAAQFWDGRAPSLEEQALGPVQNPVEMGMPDMKIVIEKLKSDPSYLESFKAAFPPDGAIAAENVGKAIASFERTILSGNSPYDRFMTGDKGAMSESAQRGMQVFKDEKKGNCETCHAGPNFTDENYNNIGVGMAAQNPDQGRYQVTRLEGHQGAFKTPTLRDVAMRGPYMHDGSQKTLEVVVDYYVKGGHRNKWLSPKIQPVRLSKQEQRDLVEFLKALSGQVTWYGKDEAQ